jgi:hypothetical protein
MSERGSSDQVAVHTNGHHPPLSADAALEPAAMEPAEAPAAAGPADPRMPRVNVKVNPIQAILGLLVFAWGIRLLFSRLRRGG